MSKMLIPGLNQLAEPEIVTVESFETLLAEFKADLLAYVAARDPEKAARLEQTLDNDSELLSMMLEAFALRLQSHERKYNARIKQMLAWWAEGTNLDARAADMGLARRVVDEGDPAAFPPVQAELEDDDDLRLRYFLAPHAPAAGSRLQYRREAMTLGERAAVTVEAPSAGTLVVTYVFADDGYAAQVKDANGRQSAPGAVTVTVLGREGDGTPSAELLAAVQEHFARDDVRPETDLVTVQAAEIVDYQISAVIYIGQGPDAKLAKAAAESALAAYAAARHALGAYVDPSRIAYELHAAGAERLELLSPAAAVECLAHQAPYCSSIAVEVRTL